jgi:hypothetical protein
MRKTTSFLLVVLAFACIWGAGSRHTPLLEKRAEYHLDSGKPLENAPPLMAFTTVVMGGFSGLLADVLWLRISYLQDDGKYLEIVQLADWITKLEPRCEEIWSYHAWNMAYNMSVAMSDLEDRWRWVESGITLLRDEGVVYNPADAALYFDVGMLFQDKVGRENDSAQRYYKFKWAEEMEQFFGGPQPDYDRIQADPVMLGRLRGKYKLEPAVMKEVDAAYGPLDWRLPQAQAIYWAYSGLQRCDRKSMIQYDRMIYQNMATAFARGRIVSDGNYDKFATGPNLDLLPNILKTFNALEHKYHHRTEGMESAYMNFLRRAALLLHDCNREEDSMSLYKRLCVKFPSPENAAGYEKFLSSVRADILGELAPSRGR